MNRHFKLPIRKKTVLYVITATLAVAVITGLYLAIQKWEFSSSRLPDLEVDAAPSIMDDDEVYSVELKGKRYVLKENVETILLLGIDKFEEGTYEQYGNRNTQQADLLLLLIMDHENKTCAALQINRDTMVTVNQLDAEGNRVGMTQEQIALAHTYGDGKEQSCKNTVEEVSYLLYGTSVDHYLSLTMEAVAALNDAVDGVTVMVKDDFSATDPTIKQGEEITLRGDQALTYVRARSSMADSSNLARMERQKQYMYALLTRVQAQTESGKAPEDMILPILPYMISDCSVQQLSELWEQIMTYEMQEIQTIAGEAVKGKEFMEYYVDEDALQAQIIELLYQEQK